jgi:hypothetical protein
LDSRVVASWSNDGGAVASFSNEGGVVAAGGGAVGGSDPAGDCGAAGGSEAAGEPNDGAEGVSSDRDEGALSAFSVMPASVRKTVLPRQDMAQQRVTPCRARCQSLSNTLKTRIRPYGRAAQRGWNLRQGASSHV